jgi:NADPH-dependent 2,4-dienoyl-CoA reductase/sulfur reductase-like enzyme
MRRYVIIGNGVAGFSAAETIRAQDPAGEILIVGDDPHGYYSRPGLAYLITGEISEPHLYPFSEIEERQRSILRRRSQARLIDPAGHRVSLSDGTSLLYDRLLLATGSMSSRLPVPGAELEGVLKLDHLEDALKIVKLARKARSAVVVGGGITALELVEGLIARGVSAHYFLRAERFWSNVLDEAESRMVEDHIRRQGVEIHYKTDLVEIIGKQGKVAGARTQDGSLVPCDLVAYAIGIQPRKDLADSCAIHTERGILVNEYMQTNAPDIFAAGDVTQYFDPLSGKYQIDSLWNTAREQGRAAGMNMSGGTVPYQKKLAFNVTRLGGITTTIIGRVGAGRDSDLATISRGDSESWRQASESTAVQEGDGANRLRLQIGLATIKGSVVMGNQAYSQPLQDLILKQVDISSIRDKLLRPGAPLGGLIIDFWLHRKGGNAPK